MQIIAEKKEPTAKSTAVADLILKRNLFSVDD
jgi:hypothetical protein